MYCFKPQGSSRPYLNSSAQPTENVEVNPIYAYFPLFYRRKNMAVLNRIRIRGAYHLAKKSGNFGLKSSGKVIFQKFRSEIVEYLQRYSSFSIRNGTTEISLPFGKLSSSSLSSAENNNKKSDYKW